jgi:hypothetical protein
MSLRAISSPVGGAVSGSTGTFTGQLTLTNASNYNVYASGAGANVFAGTTSLGGLVGAESLRVTPVASSISYIEVLGGIGDAARVFSTGSGTNVSFEYYAKGSNGHSFFTNGLFPTRAQQFVISHTASAVNYLQVTGSASTTPTLSAQGSGADLDILLTPKGTGNVRFGTYTAGVIAQAGYITIKDAGGTTRRLLVG